MDAEGKQAQEGVSKSGAVVDGKVADVSDADAVSGVGSAGVAESESKGLSDAQSGGVTDGVGSSDADVVEPDGAALELDVAVVGDGDGGVGGVSDDGDGSAPLAAEAVDIPATRRVRDVVGLRKGLGKSRESGGFFGRLAALITGRREIDPGLVDEIEEVLITSDVGVKTTELLLSRLREGLKSKELGDSDKVWAALRQEAVRILSVGDGGLALRAKPTVVLFVGVNGSGKTTTIGKMATHQRSEGRKVLLAAGDTFRAAAVQQLQVWGDRVGCEIARGKDCADPSAVVFDAIRRAAAEDVDLVLADTAGRLHTKTNLMDELKKVVRTAGKALDGAPHEILLVLDATNGQNALAQSRQFAEALPLSGIVLTKLDGTAKGGMVLGICDELKVPVRYIGIGERAEALRPFDADEFVEALLGGAAADETDAA
ncbi:MAG: signal recognition particle-docking protein FtsY [Polyangiaceae bacterium]|nr:signal recognition particle-docking protein FtsY [Polyangiaceae bacterium]